MVVVVAMAWWLQHGLVVVVAIAIAWWLLQSQHGGHGCGMVVMEWFGGGCVAMAW